jgi:hypothetical protein
LISSLKNAAVTSPDLRNFRHFSTQEVRKYFNFLQFEIRSMRFLPYMLVFFQKSSGLAQFWPKSILAKSHAHIKSIRFNAGVRASWQSIIPNTAPPSP